MSPPCIKIVSFEDVFLPKGELDEVEEYEMKDDKKRHEALDKNKLLAQRFVAGPPADRAHED